jgi:hypothetical protein
MKSHETPRVAEFPEFVRFLGKGLKQLSGKRIGVIFGIELA